MPRCRLCAVGTALQVSEQLLQKREGGCAARYKTFLPFFFSLRHHPGKLLIHLLDILIRNSHLMQNVLHRFDAELLCADKAQPLVDRFIPLHAGDKHHRGAFFAP